MDWLTRREVTKILFFLRGRGGSKRRVRLRIAIRPEFFYLRIYEDKFALGKNLINQKKNPKIFESSSL